MTVLSRLRAKYLLSKLPRRIHRSRVGWVADEHRDPSRRARIARREQFGQRVGGVDDDHRVAGREQARAVSDTCRYLCVGRHEHSFSATARVPRNHRQRFFMAEGRALVRLEHLTLQIAGDDLTLSFHDRLTVVSGIGAAERRELIDMLVGALAGGLGQRAELQYVDATGLRVRAISDGEGGVRHIDETGAPATDIPRMLGLDAEGLRRLAHVTGADLGLLATEMGRPEPAELVEARHTLATLTAELENATAARDTGEALRLELEELDEQLRQIKEGEAKRRYARLLVQLEQVRAEAAAIRGGSEAAATHKRLVASAPDVRRLAERWRRAASRAAAEVERFGDRERLDPRALQEALLAPAEVPADLENLAAAYDRAEAERVELEAKLQNWTISHLPEPSHPAVVRLGRVDQETVWRVVDEAVEANRRLEDESLALGGLEAEGLMADAAADLEAAHDAVEAAEQLAEQRRMPAVMAAAGAAALALATLFVFPPLAVLPLLAVAAILSWATVLPKRAFEAAERAEAAVLERHNISSYLGFHIRRVNATLEPGSRESLEVAAYEQRRALNHFHELAGEELSPERVLKLRDEIRRYAKALHQLEGSGAAVEETRRRLVEEVEPTVERARRRLLQACQPFGVDDLSIAVRMVRHQAASAATARLQVALEKAEKEAEALGEKLDARLAELGFDEGDLEARIGGFDWALARAEERLRTRDHARPLAEVDAELAQLEARVRREARPEWDSKVSPADAEEPDDTELQRRRDDALAAYNSASRLVPDVQRILDRRAAVERRVAVLEGELDEGVATRRVSARELEPQLQARLAAARRPGSHDETIPLLLDEALLRCASEVKWGVLDMIERCSAQVQMVYLTDDPEVVTWARRRVGVDALSLLEPVAEIA